MFTWLVNEEFQVTFLVLRCVALQCGAYLDVVVHGHSTSTARQYCRFGIVKRCISFYRLLLHPFTTQLNYFLLLLCQSCCRCYLLLFLVVSQLLLFLLNELFVLLLLLLRLRQGIHHDSRGLKIRNIASLVEGFLALLVELLQLQKFLLFFFFRCGNGR